MNHLHYMARFLLLTIVVFLLKSKPVRAFPEMIRYGYVNCVSCHISPNGGGILNDYGREIAREELAVWKSPDEDSKEHLFLYGALKDTTVEKWLKGGGDVRGLFFYRNDSKKEEGELFLMQADLEMAAVLGQFTLVGSIGAQQPPHQDPEFIARKYYAMYAINDNWNIRGGKFIPTYGILTADHVTLTKDPLQIGYRYESYNLEGSYIGDQWNAFVTGLFGINLDNGQQLDHGATVQVSWSPTEKIRIGGNFWYGKTDTTERVLTGIFGFFGLWEKWYLSSEMDYQNYIGGMKGVATTQKISYEWITGLWAYGLAEFGKSDFEVSDTSARNFGIGVQFFPRPHFEFNISYERKYSFGYQDGYDYASVLGHFYL